MKTIDLIQGSEGWHAHRNKHFNASDASAMLGLSPYKTRSELLKEMALGASKDIDAGTQYIFDKGHEFEANSRGMAEDIIGEVLFPVTGSLVVEGLPLSASFDGITIAEDITWEHKTLSKELAESLSNGRIPDSYKPQLEQQLLVSGAVKCLFMASYGTRESETHTWYVSDILVRAMLIAGWKQFQDDLVNYQHVEVITPVAALIKDLPAIRYTLNGLSLTSNLAEFKQAAQQLVTDSEQELVTDNDFATREELNKAFKAAEGKIDLMISQVISEIEDVDKFTRDLSEIKKFIAQARLTGEKKVTARKDAIRAEIKAAGMKALTAYIDMLNKRLGNPYMPSIDSDFAGVMKSKRTITSLQDAADTELARAKILANECADAIQINLHTIAEHAQYAHLMPDKQSLVLKSNDDLLNLIASRAASAKEADAKRAQDALEAEKRKAELVAPKLVEVAPKPVEAPQGVSPIDLARPPVIEGLMRDIAKSNLSDDECEELISFINKLLIKRRKSA